MSDRHTGQWALLSARMASFMSCCSQAHRRIQGRWKMCLQRRMTVSDANESKQMTQFSLSCGLHGRSPFAGRLGLAGVALHAPSSIKYHTHHSAITTTQLQAGAVLRASSGT